MTLPAYPSPNATAAEVAAWKRERAREAAHAKKVTRIARALSLQQIAMLRRVRAGEQAIDQGLDSAATRGHQVTLHSLRNAGLMVAELLTALGKDVAEKIG